MLVWVLLGFHLPGRRSPSLSRGRRANCRGWGLWERVRTPRGGAEEEAGVSNPWLPPEA